MCGSIAEAFGRNDMTSVVRLIDGHFGKNSYTLWHLFTEEKRKVVHEILEANLRGLEADFRQIFETNGAIMQAMREMRIPLPEALSTPAQFVLNTDFRRLMEAPEVDVEGLSKIAEAYETWSFKPDGEALSYIAGKRVGALMAAWAANPDDTAGLKKIEEVLAILRRLGVGLDLWHSQNIYFSTGKALYGPAGAGAKKGQRATAEWIRAFKSVGELLRINPSVFLPSKPV
jgi:hypothetical protein